MTHGGCTQSIPIRPHRRGFTMAEMMVAVTIMVIVTAIVAGLFVHVRKMIGLTQWGTETRAQLRGVVGTLAQDLENIDPKAYFLMLNRDYGWDNTAAQATLPLNSTTMKAPLLYPGDSPTADRRIWADRIAFVANGPFNTLQNLQAGGAPAIGTSARVYYGQSLWTHELADAAWLCQPAGPGVPAVNATWNPFIQQGGVNGPYYMTGWTDDFTQRPATGWTLLRRAILHVQDPAADTPGFGLNQINWRAVADSEFSMFYNSLGTPLDLFTNDALGRQVEAWAQAPTPTNYNLMALLFSPRVDTNLPSPLDPSTMARARVLLPHAARLRFQVRLSDGTVVPQLNETTDNPRLRGGITSPVYNTALTSILNPDYSLPALPWDATKPTFAVVDPATAPNTAHFGTGYQVPLRQTAYVWTPDTTNVPKLGTSPNQTMLYPVAVRIRIEVYDPQKRTPDPIRLDEWLPVRWR